MKQKKHIFIPVLLSILIMPLQFIADIALAVVDLVRMSLIAAIPAFLLVLLGQRLDQYIKDKYKLSWIVSAFAVSFVILVPIVFIAYLVPLSMGFLGSELSWETAPEFMQPTLIDVAMAVVATVVKNLLSALLFAILLMPLLFFGSFAEEALQKRFKLPKLANLFVSVFLTAALAWIVVLFVFPWVVTAVLWKLYWSPI